MKRLVVFDLDGTLTLTGNFDGELFVQALKEALGIENVNADWTTYRSVTDAGVTAEIIERNGLGQTVQSVQDHFLALLRSKLAETPCREVPGAIEMLALLHEHPDFEYSVATGSWRESALLKMRSAGLAIEGLPMATCDDFPQRERITRKSIERACSQYHFPPDTPVTLVGDAPWDVQVATNLQLHFVGIGGQSLLECGAKHVIEDFTDVDRFLELVVQS